MTHRSTAKYPLFATQDDVSRTANKTTSPLQCWKQYLKRPFGKTEGTDSQPEEIFKYAKLTLQGVIYPIALNLWMDMFNSETFLRADQMLHKTHFWLSADWPWGADAVQSTSEVRGHLHLMTTFLSLNRSDSLVSFYNNALGGDTTGIWEDSYCTQIITGSLFDCCISLPLQETHFHSHTANFVYMVKWKSGWDTVGIH